MNLYIFVTAAAVITATAVVLWNRHKTKRTMETLDHMLTLAINGEFTEDTFDESLLSALETKFAHYLSASALSAQNVATEKDRIKTFIADISHQTKTPIANLQLYGELLLEKNLSDSARNSAQAIEVQTKKLRFLIDSLVKLSRLEHGIIALSCKKQPIMPMLFQLQEQYIPAATAKGLSLTVAKPMPRSALIRSGQAKRSAIFWTMPSNIPPPAALLSPFTPMSCLQGSISRIQASA